LKQHAWHKTQAKKIRGAETRVTDANADLALYWWEVGQRLNQVYGFVTGKARSSGGIPTADMLDLCELYGISRESLTSARKFHKLAQQPAERDAVIEQYKTWRQVMNGFIRGHSAEESQRRYDAMNARCSQKVKDLRRATQAQSQHMSNVPDELLGRIEAELGSRAVAQEAIRLHISRLTAAEILLTWRKRAA
jgi:hypothetical protein